MSFLKYLVCFYIGGMVAHFPTTYLFGMLGQASVTDILCHIVLWPKVYLILLT